MNKKILLFFLFFPILSALSQPRGVHLYRIKNKLLMQSLSMLDTIITRSSNTISVSLYQIYNPLGSAHISETDEVSVKYMVSIGPDKGSELPDDHLFLLGDFLGPKLVEFKQATSNTFIIAVEHGLYAHRKKSKFLVKRTNVLLLK